jgi:hypothetical protein
MIRIDRDGQHTYRNVVLIDGGPLTVADYRGVGPYDLGSSIQIQVADRPFEIEGVSAFGQSPVRGIVHTLVDPNVYVKTLYDENQPANLEAILLRASTSFSVLKDHYFEGMIVCFSMKNGDAYRNTSEWLKEFMALDFETAKTIAEAPDRSSLADLEGGYRHLLDITHPGDPTAELAFRLLCEAWEAEQIDGVSELSGFAITAPRNLSGWLAPFGSREGQAATSEEVVAMMGDEDLKAKVWAVLNAVDCEARKNAVLTLLGRIDTRDSVEGGAK